MFADMRPGADPWLIRHETNYTTFYANGFEGHEHPALLDGRRWVDSARKADTFIVADLSVGQRARGSRDERVFHTLGRVTREGISVKLESRAAGRHEAHG